MISEPYQVSHLILQDVRTVDTAFDWLIASTVKLLRVHPHIVTYEPAVTRSTLTRAAHQGQRFSPVSLYNVYNWHYKVFSFQ